MTKPRRPSDPIAVAEAAFKPTKQPPVAMLKMSDVPGARELVSLRLDRNVLEYFQQSGPGWQDRINEALQKIVYKGAGESEHLDATYPD